MLEMTRFKNILWICLIGLISFASSVYAQQIEYRTLPGSKMWIDGTSTLNDYTCLTKNVDGYAEIDSPADLKKSSPDKDKAFLTVMVRSLNCGKELMNDDMYNAMKSNKYPFIKYELLDAHLVGKADSASGWYKLETIGNLLIAGDTNKVNILMNVKKIGDGVYRLVGQKALTMNDFGITPPTHFFGLIRAHEGLTVHFDLLAARTQAENLANHGQALK